MQQEFITLTFNRTKIAIRCADILYVIMSDDHSRIHMLEGNVYRSRMTLKEKKKQKFQELSTFWKGTVIGLSISTIVAIVAAIGYFMENIYPLLSLMGV